MGITRKRDALPPSIVKYIPLLQQELTGKADPSCREWWEKYLKQVIPFRGVKMADIRSVTHRWIRDNSIDNLADAAQRDLALALIRLTFSEDKMAGILYLQEVLIPNAQIRCKSGLSRFARLFADGYIFDWNTCDWFCVKVLGPLADREGEPCARAISGWKSSDNLWQRRAAGVAFVNLASRGDEYFDGFAEMLLETCARTVECPERFAQTGTGWVLRELSVAEPERVSAFVETRLASFSREGLRYALAKFPAPVKQRLMERRKSLDRQRREPS